MGWNASSDAMATKNEGCSGGGGGAMSSCQDDDDNEPQPFPFELLPLDLILKTVLGWLPTRSLLRFRTVCKLWNSTISSPSFFHFPLQPPQQHPWLLFFPPRSFDRLLAFDFDAHSWFQLDMPFLAASSSSLPSSPLRMIWCAGSARDRLLLKFDSTLHVCNPLTKSLFPLPPFKSLKLIVTQGFAASDSKSARDLVVLVIGNNNKSDLAIEAYSARKNTWDIVGNLPCSFVIKHDQMVECNGLFYGLLLTPCAMLVVGEVHEGLNWRIQSLPDLDQKTNQRLLTCQRALFMACYDYENGGLLMWKFDASPRVWIKLDRMPDMISQDVRAISLSDWFDCVGVGKYICFRALSSSKVLAYNVCAETWNWLPDLPFSFDTILTRGYQFEPRLDYSPIGLVD